jgi:hypothetical protein
VKMSSVNSSSSAGHLSARAIYLRTLTHIRSCAKQMLHQNAPLSARPCTTSQIARQNFSHGSQTEQVAQRLFEMFSADSDEGITKLDFLAGLSKLTPALRLSMHEVDHVFPLFDLDNDGRLSYNEFVSMLLPQYQAGKTKTVVAPVHQQIEFTERLRSISAPTPPQIMSPISKPRRISLYRPTNDNAESRQMPPPKPFSRLPGIKGTRPVSRGSGGKPHSIVLYKSIHSSNPSSGLGMSRRMKRRLQKRNAKR